MLTSRNLRKLVACVLACALFVAGLIIITTRERRVAGNHLPPPLTPTAGAPSAQTAPRAEAVDDETRGRVSEAYMKLPLSFEENRGQVNSEVRYVSRGAGYTLFLTPTEAVLSLQKAEDGGRKEGRDLRRGLPDRDSARGLRHAARKRTAAILRMKLKGASPSPPVAGEEVMRARTNYLIGSDPAKWRTEVPRYARVRYAQVYPGVDVIYYGEQRQLEYDFEVAPGVDSRQIALEFSGVERMRVERGTGELVLGTAGGEVRQRRPAAYQEVGGERREVASRYVIKGRREVGIEVGEYDRARPLVIDPVLTYSTYLGGYNTDNAYDIALDSSGMAYVVGSTTSPDFPTVNPYKESTDNYDDAFIAKLNPNLSGADSLVYSTYFGGMYFDSATAVAVDAAGVVYVAGLTNSPDFPVRNQYQTKPGPWANADLFVIKLDPRLPPAASLLYGTYLGGDGDEVATAIAADSSGNAYVTGFTWSQNFPTFHGLPTNRGENDAFVTKLDTESSGADSLVYSTILGGGGWEEACDIAVDSAGVAYVTGETYSADFPVLHQYQTKQSELRDAFVTKLDTNKSGAAALLYSTYLGGERGEAHGSGIAIDSAGVAYVVGSTSAPDFPMVNSYQPTINPYHESQSVQFGFDGFVAKLDTNVSGPAAMLYSTYLGGSGSDIVEDIAMNSAGEVYVSGNTSSPDFPTLHPYQTDQGGRDAFVAKLDTNRPGAASLLYSTYLGGNGDDFAEGLAADSSGNAYVMGYTQSSNFPKLRQYQSKQGLNLTDAFFTKLTDTHTVSGRVTSDGATGIGGVTVTLGGSQNRTVLTDGSGNYSLELQVGGNYTLTPSRSGLTFTPSKQSFVNLQEDQTGVNFRTRPATISGRVTVGTSDGAALGGVTMTLTGGANFTPRTVTTTSYGTYSFGSVPTPGSYKLTPSKTNYTFSPAQAALLNLTTSQPGTNFVATLKTYTLSGGVKFGAAGLGGVTMKLESPTPAGFAARTATTSSTGAYSFPNVPAGRSYTVTPIKNGYQFTPASKSLANLSASQTGLNFSVKVYSISGRVVRAGTSTGIGAVTVTLTSPTPAGFPVRTAQTTSTGYYTFTTLPAGRNFTLKPTKSGFTFSPTSRSITNLSGNVPAGPSTSFTGTGP
ncbi:MAG TPA: SBBP repeat-containing protein [Pyrinomonadaceae bacterium]|jgi:hypothetical protein